MPSTTTRGERQALRANSTEIRLTDALRWRCRMRNQWVLVGILAGALTAAPVMAQHKTPNQQPTTDGAPSAPAGELMLGTLHLAKATTADGKPLPAGTYQVRPTAPEAK